MIIIRTSNGDVLINEKAIQSIVHIKDKKNVVVVQSDGKLWAQNIEDVETVIYANDAQPINYESKSTKVEELERALAAYNSAGEYYKKLLHNAVKMVSSLESGLLDAVDNMMQRKEENRFWGRIEREYEEAKKALEQYRQESNRLFCEHDKE